MVSVRLPPVPSSPSLIGMTTTTKTEKYAHQPMDLADATLLVTAEASGIRDIITIDSDFFIFQDKRRKYLNNIFL